MVAVTSCRVLAPRPRLVLCVTLVGLVLGKAWAEDTDVFVAATAPGTSPPTGLMAVLCSHQSDIVGSVSSPIGIYLHRMKRDLQSCPYQAAIAAVALAVGGLCVWNGPRTWRALFTAAVVVAAASLARIEAEAWDFDTVSEVVLMFQMAFTIGVAVQSGFDSFQLLFGTVAGFVGFYLCGGWTRSVDGVVPGFALFWYGIGALLGAMVLTVWQQPVLVTLGPLVGGFLVVTGLECLVGRLAASVAAAPAPAGLPPLDGPWIDAASDLLFPVGAAALAIHGGCAMLATLVYKSGSGDEQRLPAVLCLSGGIVISGAVAGAQGSKWLVGLCVMWATFTTVSAYYQLGLLEHWTAKSLADVAHTFSSVGSSYFGGNFRDPYEPIGNMRDVEACSSASSPAFGKR